MRVPGCRWCRRSCGRNIAVYEAARSLLGYITPDFDEVAKVRRAKRLFVRDPHAMWRARQVHRLA